jgi:hypothetical protein
MNKGLIGEMHNAIVLRIFIIKWRLAEASSSSLPFQGKIFTPQ